MKKSITTICIMVTFTLTAQDKQDNTQKWSAGRPDGHAPISVMGDHLHGKGEWMFSYRYMYMHMEDLKQGSDDASFENALGQTMATPTRMPMNMHMLGAMFAPSSRITIMAMLNYISLEMDHITRMGGTFTTEAGGFGDIQISGMYQFLNKNRQALHGQVGVSLPTGSVTESDVIPASAPNVVELPYPMQIGSGTLDTHLGLTYLGQANKISWGSQIRGIFRFGNNSREFRYGNRYNLSGWLAVVATDWLSFSARIEGASVYRIEGVDPNLNPAMVITADTRNSGGTFINSGIGLNTYISNGTLKNLRFGLEFGYPLYQDLNGIQLKLKEALVFGVQYAL